MSVFDGMILEFKPSTTSLSFLFLFFHNFVSLDKTSGSLFKTGGGIELARIKELPVCYYNGYASLDEFLSASNSNSDNQQQTQDGSGGKTEKTVTKRHHQRSHTKSLQIKSGTPGLAAIKNTFGLSSKLKFGAEANMASGSSSSSSSSSKRNQRRAQDVIDEMNRQYDHNLCLDRFINEMEQMQKKKEESGHKQQSQQQQTQQQQSQQQQSQEQQQQDPQQQNQQQSENMKCNVSPSNSSLSSCSSVVPQSNEDTDSGSRNSESIKSSTPENGGKTEKEENNSTSSKTSSSKDEQPASEKKSPKEKKSKPKSKESPLSSTTSTSKIKMQVDSTMEKQSGYTESGIELTGGSNSSVLSSSSVLDVAGEEKNNKNYKGGKLGRKRKRGYIYNPKPVVEKPPKKFVPVEAKDQSYWDKRQRNNEAARKSREMRREKVKEIHEKLMRLKKENEALRVAITLLIQRNESLESVIEDYEKTQGSTTSLPPTTGAPPINC